MHANILSVTHASFSLVVYNIELRKRRIYSTHRLSGLPVARVRNEKLGKCHCARNISRIK